MGEQLRSVLSDMSVDVVSFFAFRAFSNDAMDHGPVIMGLFGPVITCGGR